MARAVQHAGFHLIKWYLDCVSERGDVFVGYCAQLRWRALALHYSSSLELHNDGEPEEKSSLKPSPVPVCAGGTVDWVCPPLQLHGRWDALEEPLAATVFESDLGAVEWRCLTPRAAATIETGGRRSTSGLGYSEQLTLSTPPWLLPVRELHWGRFLSGTGSLAWIDWRGSHSTRLAFCDGAPASVTRLTATELLLEDGTMLRLEDRKPLRDGPLGGVLSSIPGLSSLVPGRLLEVRERKWRSRGILLRPGGGRLCGWAIHEVVSWP